MSRGVTFWRVPSISFGAGLLQVRCSLIPAPALQAWYRPAGGLSHPSRSVCSESQASGVYNKSIALYPFLLILVAGHP